LAPGLNLYRLPQGGRNFEYLSGEDPYLGYVYAQSAVKGIQDQHVMAVAKHFIANEQETGRNYTNVLVDERTRFEMYYPPFEGAIQAGVGSIMCSYNKINDHYACENNGTLNQDLRNTLGFKGFVMSDWNATHNKS
jgi:beta-glucosidase